MREFRGTTLNAKGGQSAAFAVLSHIAANILQSDAFTVNCTWGGIGYTFPTRLTKRNLQKKENVMDCNVAQHKMHICALKAEKNDDCIKSLTDKPTVVCGNCGAKANSPENVCDPQELT
jgi:hypothetical protein